MVENNKYLLWVYNIRFIISILLFFLNLDNSRNDEQFYKSIFFENYERIFSFTTSQIMTYNSKDLTKKATHQFNHSEQNIFNNSEAEMISSIATLKQTQNEYSQIYIIIKNYLYNFSGDGVFNSEHLIENMDIVPSNLIFKECKLENNNLTCLLFIAFININKNLNIFLMEKPNK